MEFINRLKRNYLRSYLIYSVRRIEKLASENRRWSITPEIMGLLAQLLVIYTPILVTKDTMSSLKQIKIKSQFGGLEALEFYGDEFINQTLSFAKGEESRKPRIESLIKEYVHERDITVTSFLEIETEAHLLRALESLVALSKRLDDHLKDIPHARRKILLNMLQEIILPAYTVIEQIYEVVNSEDQTN